MGMRRLASLLAAISALATTAPAHAATLEVLALDRDGKPLAETVVFLESREARAAVRPAQDVEIEQADKRFTQRVTVVPTGTSVQFPNRDKVRHHVYSFSQAKPFELKLYIGTPANPVLFDRSGVVVLGCNIHDQMIAWVLVVDTPHHALAPASGRVRLDNVPPGSYRLRSWHPDLPVGSPALDQALEVPATGTSITLRLPVAG